MNRETQGTTKLPSYNNSYLGFRRESTRSIFKIIMSSIMASASLSKIIQAYKYIYNIYIYNKKTWHQSAHLFTKYLCHLSSTTSQSWLSSLGPWRCRHSASVPSCHRWSTCRKNHGIHGIRLEIGIDRGTPTSSFYRCWLVVSTYHWLVIYC